MAVLLGLKGNRSKAGTAIAEIRYRHWAPKKAGGETLLQEDKSNLI